MRCPGQDRRYWSEDAIFEIACPFCGQILEFFKDDTMRKCPHCKGKVPNPKLDFGCAVYCKYAEICLGELPPELISEKANLLKGKLLSHLTNLLPQKFLYQLEKALQELEEALKDKGFSPGAKLFLLVFYYLTPEEREYLYRKSHLPEGLWEEIKGKLEDLPQGLSVEALKELLLKEGDKSG